LTLKGKSIGVVLGLNPKQTGGGLAPEKEKTDTQSTQKMAQEGKIPKRN